MASIPAPITQIGNAFVKRWQMLLKFKIILLKKEIELMCEFK
jgi:hypothetical protein